MFTVPTTVPTTAPTTVPRANVFDGLDAGGNKFQRLASLFTRAMQVVVTGIPVFVGFGNSVNDAFSWEVFG